MAFDCTSICTSAVVANVIVHIDGLVQDCSNSSANALELLQSRTKPLIYSKNYTHFSYFFSLVLWFGTGWFYPYPPGSLHWHWHVPVPVKWPWRIWGNAPCQSIKTDNISTTKQTTTKPCSHFLWQTATALVLYSNQAPSNSPSDSHQTI